MESTIQTLLRIPLGDIPKGKLGMQDRVEEGAGAQC